MIETWPWLTLALLGAYHGINPAMGWLFAVALGLQERSRKTLLRALLPIALGHETSIALIVVLVSVTRLVIPPQVLHLVGAAALIAFGAYKFLQPRSHPRWVGMRISLAELVLWSFLMSTAHGAGLMLLPILFRLPGPEHVHAAGGDGGVAALTGTAWIAHGTAAGLVHTLAMVVTMTAVAILVFEKFGVGVLRRAWLNLDRVWAGAVMISGAFTLFSP